MQNEYRYGVPIDGCMVDNWETGARDQNESAVQRNGTIRPLHLLKLKLKEKIRKPGLAATFSVG